MEKKLSHNALFGMVNKNFNSALCSASFYVRSGYVFDFVVDSRSQLR
jgi:hypothetical protein